MATSELEWRTAARIGEESASERERSEQRRVDRV